MRSTKEWFGKVMVSLLATDPYQLKFVIDVKRVGMEEKAIYIRKVFH